MAMVSWPFDSTVTYDGQGNPIYAKAYSSDVLANILRKYFRNGVFTDEEGCFQVLENGGMRVQVSPGHCLIQGRHGYNEAAATLTVSNADPALPRIDLVVLRLNLGVSALSIEPFIVTGSTAVSPAAPALTRNSTVYEIALAEIHVAAGASAITQAVITDTRLDSSRCGVVASIIGDTDTSTYYAQIAADLAAFKAGREADFDAWFAGIVDILDTSTAGNLLNRIQALETHVTVNSDAAPVLGTLAHNGEYRCANASPTAAPSMTISTISSVSTQFCAIVIFKAPDETPPVVTNNSGRTLKYCGMDVRNGVFTPVAGRKYQLSFVWDSIDLNCYIVGVL